MHPLLAIWGNYVLPSRAHKGVLMPFLAGTFWRILEAQHGVKAETLLCGLCLAVSHAQVSFRLPPPARDTDVLEQVRGSRGR